MPDIKIKPVMDKPKAAQQRNAPRMTDAMLLRSCKGPKEEQEPENRNPVRYATDRVEAVERHGMAATAEGARRVIPQRRKKKRFETGGEFRKETMFNSACSEQSGPPLAKAKPLLKNAAAVEKHRAMSDRSAFNRSMRLYRTHNIPKDRAKQAALCRSDLLSGERVAADLNLKRQTGSTLAEHGAAQQWRKAAQKSAQREMVKKTANHTKAAAKRMGRWAAQSAAAAGKAVVAAGKSIVATGGGMALIVVILIGAVIGGIAASPFGILFAGEGTEAGAVPVSAAVAQLNDAFHARLEALQAGGAYDEVTIQGEMADWVDILAVFAAKVAGSNEADAADVVTLDADRIARLQTVFADMNLISTEVEVIRHAGDDSADGWVERILHITITPRSAADMPPIYHFAAQQTAAMNELLEQRELLQQLIGDLFHIHSNATEVLENLPEDLLPARRMVVEQACSLVGKVNYFWGGKSLTLGWDSRWGQLKKVVAAGSSTTGTYRPYGLDCSGFVDWVFYNATDGAYVIGHGGGAHMQHVYCTEIRWDEAQPGDLVFYPDDTHVGIVGGWDTNGNLLVIHCSSGANNVVITGVEGFAAISRPHFYAEI